MAKKGDWVQISSVLLKAEERTARLPEETKKCDLVQWTKGFLQEDHAALGDEVTVVTAVGRCAKGTLVDETPHYTHDFGGFIPEIMTMEKQIKEIMFGGVD